MGRALLSGWEKKHVFSSVTVVEPKPTEELKRYKLYNDGYAIERENFDVVVVAVKPQIVGEVLLSLKRFSKKNTVFISIAAGKPVAALQAGLGSQAAIIRTMPNTPAMIGQGITVCVANAHVTKEQKETAQAVLGAVGSVIWIEDEEKMHAVTALSGSGPAYVFALIEAMQKGGEALGLDKELAAQLARKTVQGAAALAAHQTDKTPEELRRSVTSPNGTTEAALSILLADSNGLDKLMEMALRAAARRSQELI